MIDTAFIQELLGKGKIAKQKVQQELSPLSLDQLNWKRAPGSWSVAQCLEHLIVSHSTYFPGLEKIISGTYKKTLWEKYSPFTRLCGRIMKDQLQERVTRKMKAPARIRPSVSEIDDDIVQRYFDNLESFLNYVSGCQAIDIDHTVITSPMIPIVTYSLRDAFQFLLQHEHRHINQAIRVKGNDDFPQ